VPVVFRTGRYRFFFFSNEGTEPRHIHVESGGKYAKFWLDWVELAEQRGYNAPELKRIRKLVERNRALLRRRWNEFFGSI
jgi:hypothetical protein